MIFMDFIEYNQCSKIQDLYYARLLNCGVARNIVSGEASLSNKNETETLASFFWEMTE